MAFENVFSNIDFMAPTRAAWQEQASIQQMLGNLGEAYQKRKELEQRQLELQAKQQAEQNKPVDVFKMAENALLKTNQGIPLTEQEQASIQTAKQLAKPQIYADPITDEMVVRPSPWSTLTGGQATTAPPSGQTSIDMMLRRSVEAPAQPIPTGGSPALRMSGAGQPLSYVDDIGLTPDQQQAAMDNLNRLNEPAAPMGGVGTQEIDQSPYKAGGILKGTRAGKLREEESRQKLQEARAAEEMKRSIQGLERFNEGQLASASFANRMVESSNIINSLEAQFGDAKTGFAGATEAVLSTIPSMGITDKMGKAIVELTASPEQQKYLNAAKNWIRANLRKESGAVIGDQEMIDEYSLYFPVFGDSPELIQQKNELRKQTEKGMITQSAGAYNMAFEKNKNGFGEKSFKSIEEAEAANLPVGTKILINGRKAIVR